MARGSDFTPLSLVVGIAAKGTPFVLGGYLATPLLPFPIRNIFPTVVHALDLSLPFLPDFGLGTPMVFRPIPAWVWPCASCYALLGNLSGLVACHRASARLREAAESAAAYPGWEQELQDLAGGRGSLAAVAIA